MKVVRLLAFACLIGVAGSAFGTPPWGPPIPGQRPAPCGTGGQIVETASSGLIGTFEVLVTDCHGKVIPGSSMVQSGAGQVIFNVPGQINGVQVGDFSNHNIANVHAPRQIAGAATAQVDDGAESFMNGESLFQDPETGLWQFEGAFAQFDFRAMAHGNLRIPDLYADTNGDGVIGQGDVLYSWADLRVYPQEEPSFSLGDHFTVVNGRVAALPGMWFSTTPIFLDSVLGPQPSGGEWFSSALRAPEATALDAGTGDSVVLTEHELVSTVPEPAQWLLLLAGGAGLIGFKASRRRSNDDRANYRSPSGSTRPIAVLGAPPLPTVSWQRALRPAP
jgi:hypothetical protein